jgi:hypothetical protein
VQYVFAYLPDTLWSVDITNCSNQTISIGGALPNAGGSYSGRCWHIAYTPANDFFNTRQLLPGRSTRLYTTEIGDDAGWYNACNNENDVTKYMYTYINDQVVGFFAIYTSQIQKSSFTPVIPNKWLVHRVIGKINNEIDIQAVDTLIENEIKNPKQPHIHLLYYSSNAAKPLSVTLDQVNLTPTTEYLDSLYSKCL